MDTADVVLLEQKKRNQKLTPLRVEALIKRLPCMTMAIQGRAYLFVDYIIHISLEDLSSSMINQETFKSYY